MCVVRVLISMWLLQGTILTQQKKKMKQRP